MSNNQATAGSNVLTFRENDLAKERKAVISKLGIADTALRSLVAKSMWMLAVHGRHESLSADYNSLVEAGYPVYAELIRTVFIKNVMEKFGHLGGGVKVIDDNGNEKWAVKPTQVFTFRKGNPKAELEADRHDRFGLVKVRDKEGNRPKGMTEEMVANIRAIRFDGIMNSGIDSLNFAWTKAIGNIGAGRQSEYDKPRFLKSFGELIRKAARNAYNLGLSAADIQELARIGGFDSETQLAIRGETVAVKPEIKAASTEPVESFETVHELIKAGKITAKPPEISGDTEQLEENHDGGEIPSKPEHIETAHA